MKAFEYRRAKSLEQAVEDGQAEHASFVAGGTLLVDLLRLDVERPDRVIDINDLGWTRVEEMNGGLRIGALVNNTELAHHSLVEQRYPVLSQALLAGASPQIRNMATLGGNLLQRTRCPYFRDVGVAACNKREPGSGCAALEGYSRMHAVLGVSDRCIAAHPSDMCVALVALDAVAVVQGPRGSRKIPVSELHTLPGTHPEVETVLARGELVSHVELPPLVAAHSAYVKVRDRASFAFALASAAVVLDLDDGVIRGARVALGGVATKPWRSPVAEQALVGHRATRALFETAASRALEGAKTTPHNAFKVKLAERALMVALANAEKPA